jgi:hypothetical protein
MLRTALTVWSRILLEKLIVAQTVEKFPAVYVIRRFVTARTTVHDRTLY